MFKAVKFSHLVMVVTLAALVPLTVLADEATPAWLKQAAAYQAPAYDKKVNAVVLQNEETVNLDNSGRLVTTQNHAVRILAREGRSEAVALAFYLVNFGKVRDIEAWIIRPDGTTKYYGKKDVVDRISDPDDVYNEGRVKIINASSDVDTGYVFGYSITTEDSPLFYQDRYNFQRDLPTVISRYTLNLPTGWKASAMVFNHPNIEPKVSGSSYTWEARDLPAIKDEPLSPSFVNLAPRMAVNYGPGDGAATQNKAFGNWTDVSKWGSGLHDGQVIVDDAIAIKARDLTANSKNELEKIQAIGRYVQNLQYISIDIGVGYGNGFKPRSSTLVLGRGYGDCKDKANLMRALLKAIKIESFPVAIYSGDPDFVRKEWASPGQFNHCILAVKVSDGTVAATIVDDAKLGRLLMFDATDSFTPVGDLPDHLQGSMALVMAGENGGLVKMPVTPPDFNAWNRSTEVNLLEDGSIKGMIRERVTGQDSSAMRGVYRSLSNSDFNKLIEGWLTRGATAAQLLKLTPTDKQAEAGFDLDVEFAAPAYGQVMQNRLLVFKPAITNRTNSIYLTEKTRVHPVMIDSESFSETATFSLPAGFIVDEMPDAVNLNTQFGKYSTKYEVKENKLLFTRSLVMSRMAVPVEKYDEVRAFYSKMLEAEQAPVVLVRK